MAASLTILDGFPSSKPRGLNVSHALTSAIDISAQLLGCVDVGMKRSGMCTTRCSSTLHVEARFDDHELFRGRRVVLRRDL